MDETPVKRERLFCLDALRGLDMLFLTVFRGLIFAVAAVCGGAPEWLNQQLRHPGWGGFTAYDQIMPCFIFMCGAAVPLALKRHLKDGRPTASFWKHVGGRLLLLWIAGMFIQGRLTSFDVMQISPYSNTLQAIAAGYVIAALVFLVKKRWIRFAAPFALAGVYTFCLQAFGDPTSPSGNCAQLVEQWFVGLFGFPPGAAAYKTGNYTWCLTSLMFGAMAVWGSNCTEIITSEKLSQWRKAGLLFAFAALLTAVGWTAQIWIAPVKQIFALSFTARSMGVCIALLATLYIVTDIWKLRRGWWLVILFGQFSFACYILRNGFGGALDEVATRLGGGMRAFVSPEWYKVIHVLLAAAALTGALVIRRKLKELSLLKKKAA